MPEEEVQKETIPEDDDAIFDEVFKADDDETNKEEAKDEEETVAQAEPEPEPEQEETVIATPEHQSLPEKEEPATKVQEDVQKEEETPPVVEQPQQPLFALEHLYDDFEEGLKEELKEYENDFDSVSKYEGLKRDHAIKKIVQYIDGTFKALIENISPYLAASGEIIKSAHYEAIRGAHSDFESIRDGGDLQAWIKEQPKYLRDSYDRVYKSGDTQEVIDLFSRYKKERGIVAPSNGNSEDGKIKEKIRNLSVVKNKASNINVGGAKKADDFDGAFDEAVGKR